LATPPRDQRHEFATLNPEQARRFLLEARRDRFEALYVLAITTGMRQGELLALRWKDVGLEEGSLSVRATLQRTKDGMQISEPKTAGSRRNISLGSLEVD